MVATFHLLFCGWVRPIGRPRNAAVVKAGEWLLLLNDNAEFDRRVQVDVDSMGIALPGREQRHHGRSRQSPDNVSYRQDVSSLSLWVF